MNSINKIEIKIDEIKTMLLEKNEQYGNSSLEPLDIFNKKATDNIEARIEDKISRLKNIDKDTYPIPYYDTIKDLVGYFILYLIALEDEHNELFNK